MKGFSKKPTTPSPGDERRKHTTQNGTNTTGYRPDALRKAHDKTSYSVTVSKMLMLVTFYYTYLRLNRSLMHICTRRIKPPPAIPWNALPTIKAIIVFAVAQTTELAKKIANAARTIGLRPQISENLAHIGPDEALARRYAAPIHV